MAEAGADDITNPGAFENAPVVVRRISHHFFVDDGEREWSCALRARLRKEGRQVLIGDRVALDGAEPDTGQAAINEVLPRRNKLDRPAIANVDQLLLVTAADSPPFNPNLLDRLLVLASIQEIPAAVAFNKRDLVDAATLEALTAPYRAIGVPVVSTGAKHREVDGLVPFLTSKVTVLAGPSGAGKSSILNALAPGLQLRALEVSEKLQRGRHTTTYASLYRVELGGGAFGLVADTPGFSFLEFPPLVPEELGWHFPEMAALIPECRMSKCLHREEPHCAVKERASLPPTRYASYLGFLDELLALEARLSAQRKAEASTKAKVGAAGKVEHLAKLGAEAREGGRRVTRQQADTWLADAEDEAGDLLADDPDEDPEDT